MSLQITQGTQSYVYTKNNGGTEVQVVKLDVGSGTALADFGGTITAVNNLAAGTITKVNGGTISTIGLPDNSYQIIATTGTNTFGTVKAAVSGSAIYITDLIISAGSATVVEIGDGTTGASDIIGSLTFAQNGGMVSNFVTPLKTSTSGTLVYKQSVGCPLSITCIGFVK